MRYNYLLMAFVVALIVKPKEELMDYSLSQAKASL